MAGKLTFDFININVSFVSRPKYLSQITDLKVSRSVSSLAVDVYDLLSVQRFVFN
jgi:hypothetical protein